MVLIVMHKLFGRILIRLLCRLATLAVVFSRHVMVLSPGQSLED